jgi:hypothetical protein
VDALNKKAFMAAVTISALLISIVGMPSAEVVRANWLVPHYTPITDLPTITVKSPLNGTNHQSTFYLNFTITEPSSWFTDNTPLGSIYSISYLLDGANHSIYQIPNWSLDNIKGTKNYTILLDTLSDGNHNLQLIVEGASFYTVPSGIQGINFTAENKEWTFNVTEKTDFTVNISSAPTENPRTFATPSPSPALPSPSALPSYQIDTSWIIDAKQLVQNYQPYTNNSNPEVTLSYCNMYMAENGAEQLIYYGNGDTLSTYLGDLLRNATVEKGSTSEDYLARVLANDMVVVLTYRVSILGMQHPEAKYYQGYFILEDNLNEGLRGMVIAREMATNYLDLVAVPNSSPTSSPTQQATAEPSPTPFLDRGMLNPATIPTIIALVTIAVVGILFYFKKRKRS